MRPSCKIPMVASGKQDIITCVGGMGSRMHLQAHGSGRLQEGGRAVTAEHMLQCILAGYSLGRHCWGWCEERGAGKWRRKARRGHP